VVDNKWQEKRFRTDSISLKLCRAFKAFASFKKSLTNKKAFKAQPNKEKEEEIQVQLFELTECFLKKAHFEKEKLLRIRRLSF
jgi:hypothetical protein